MKHLCLILAALAALCCLGRAQIDTSYLLIQGPFGPSNSVENFKWEVNYQAGSLTTGQSLLNAVFGTPVDTGAQFTDEFGTPFDVYTASSPQGSVSYINFGTNSSLSLFTIQFTLNGVSATMDPSYSPGWNYYVAGGGGSQTYAAGSWTYSNDGNATRLLANDSFDGWGYGATFPPIPSPAPPMAQRTRISPAPRTSILSLNRPALHSSHSELCSSGSEEDDNPSVKETLAMKGRHAFTLLELLVVICIIAILAALSYAAFSTLKSLAQGAYCANSLRQLGAATQMYLADNNHVFFKYSQAAPGGKLWYFGFESSASLGSPEGSRSVDVTQSPLYPYVHNVGGVEVCPSFPYGQAIWKPKYQGASWGYGFNTFLSGENSLQRTVPSQVIVFGDCAQINTFQVPASPNNPMLEEFYMVENTYTTIHFRHGNHANMLFLDGHIDQMLMSPGTLDTRMPSANIGRITPLGSMQYLQ